MCVSVFGSYTLVDQPPLGQKRKVCPFQEEVKAFLPSRTKMQARMAMRAPRLRLTGRT